MTLIALTVMTSKFFYAHRSTITHVDAACYRPSSVLCRFVTIVSPAINGLTDRGAIWVVDFGGPRGTMY